LKKKQNPKIKHELGTIYIDTSGGKHLVYEDALCAQAQIDIAYEGKLKQKKNVMNIVELIMRILEKKNWGVYYKNQAIQPLELQDGNSLYQVNQVDESELEKVIEEVVTWQYSQKDSPQNKNSMNG
tara:strand:- start:11561 stop:11938 length:378 start_codon:yes stop_codon:yes gene_type:complete